MEKYLRPSVAEFVGTFALVFLGCGTVCATQLALAPGQAPPAVIGLSAALAQGLLYAALVTATLPLSGGFLNPAITLTLWVFRRIELQAACWLIGAQVLGAVLAGLVLRFMFTTDALFPALPAQGITPHLNVAAFQSAGDTPSYIKILWSGIGIELVLTFVLSFVIFATVLDPRAPRLGGLSVGLTLTALVLMGYILTGAGLNPARWFGTALWEATEPGHDAFRDHTVYWVGPVFGALLGGAVYEYLLRPGLHVPPPVEMPAATSEASAPVTSTLFRPRK